jgi:hypothetical protein
MATRVEEAPADGTYRQVWVLQLAEMSRVAVAGLESLHGELAAAAKVGDREAEEAVRADIATVREWLVWIAHQAHDGQRVQA